MSTSSALPQTIEEKIQFAQKLKDEGNEHFKKGEWKRAIRKYKSIFLYINGLGSSPMQVLSGASQSGSDSPVSQLQLTANLNLSAAYLKLNEFRRAREYADKVITADPNNVKALFRKAQAYLGMNDIDGGRTFLEKAQSLAPEDVLIKREFKRLLELEAKHKEKEKRLFKGMFDRLSNTSEEEENQQQQ